MKEERNLWGTGVSKRGDTAKGRENRSGAARGDGKMERSEEEGGRRVQGVGGVHPSISIPRWLLGL